MLKKTSSPSVGNVTGKSIRNRYRARLQRLPVSITRTATPSHLYQTGAGALVLMQPHRESDSSDVDFAIELEPAVQPSSQPTRSLGKDC